MSPVAAAPVTVAEQWTAVLYGRKSKFNGPTAGRKAVRSVREQDSRNRRAAADLGASIFAAYEDEDASASWAAKKPRPGWNDVLAAIRSGKANLLITWEPSRADRVMDTWVPFITECGARRVAIFITDHTRRDPYLPWEDDDRVALLKLGLGSEEEVRIMRSRILRSKRENAVAGLPNSTPLYGYTRVYDHRGKLVKIVPHPGESLIVQEIFDRYSQWETQAGIVKDLDDRGILAPQAAAATRELVTCDDPERREVLEERVRRVKWTSIQIRRMVSNPAYLGKFVHQGQVTGDAMWPPLIDEPAFCACEAVTEERRQAYPDNGPPREGGIKYLLSCLAVCGKCGRFLVPGGYSQAKMSYTCQPRAGPGGGCAARVMGRMDEYVTTAILTRLGRPDIIALMSDGDQQREADEHLAAAKVKETRLAEAADSHARDGVPSLAMYTRMERELTAAIKAHRAAARQLTAAASPLLAKLLEDPARIRETWENDLTLAQQRAIIRALTKRIALYPAGRGSRAPLRETVVIEWAGEDDNTEDNTGEE